MRSVIQHDRALPAQKSAEGGAADHRSQPARDRAPAGDALGASLNRSPRSQSLLQLREALDRSPRMQALQGLERGLNELPPVDPAPVQKKPNATGLPDNLKAGVESLSGLAMDDVRVHFNSPKPAAVHAHAYAQGSDIHVAPGQEQHLAHEAWHVVQQKQGRVKPTLQMKGIPINDDAGLEREADRLGARASLRLPAGWNGGVAGRELGTPARAAGRIFQFQNDEVKKYIAEQNIDDKHLNVKLSLENVKLYCFNKNNKDQKRTGLASAWNSDPERKVDRQYIDTHAVNRAIQQEQEQRARTLHAGKTAAAASTITKEGKQESGQGASTTGGGNVTAASPPAIINNAAVGNINAVTTNNQAASSVDEQAGEDVEDDQLEQRRTIRRKAFEAFKWASLDEKDVDEGKLFKQLKSWFAEKFPKNSDIDDVQYVVRRLAASRAAGGKPIDDEEFEKDIKDSEDRDPQEMLTEGYWKRELGKLAPPQVVADTLTPTKTKDYTRATIQRPLDEIVQTVGPKLIADIEKAGKGDKGQLKLYKAMRAGPAQELVEWFKGSQKDTAKPKTASDEKSSAKITDKSRIIPVGGHVGGREQAASYLGDEEKQEKEEQAKKGGAGKAKQKEALQAIVLIEFTLKPGAHRALFDPQYMAIKEAGNTPALIAAHQKHKTGKQFPTAAGGEGNLPGYIGLKSENRGPFSLTLGKSDATRLLFQQFIANIQFAKADDEKEQSKKDETIAAKGGNSSKKKPVAAGGGGGDVKQVGKKSAGAGAGGGGGSSNPMASSYGQNPHGKKTNAPAASPSASASKSPSKDKSKDKKDKKK